MLQGAVGIFGMSGLFGFFGIFYKKDIGRFSAFCSNCSDLILIKSNKTFLISPYLKEQFIASIKNRISI